MEEGVRKGGLWRKWREGRKEREEKKNEVKVKESETK